MVRDALRSAPRQRKFWGWGYEGEGPTDDERARIGQVVAARFGIELGAPLRPPFIDEIRLGAPRITPPDSIAAICSTTTGERAAHSYGKSYRDVVRSLRREYANPPDVVAFPRDEQEVRAVLDWCDAVRAVAIPYGGGSSVVGGVEPPPAADRVVSIDLGRLDRVLEVDRT